MIRGFLAVIFNIGWNMCTCSALRTWSRTTTTKGKDFGKLFDSGIMTFTLWCGRSSGSGTKCGTAYGSCAACAFAAAAACAVAGAAREGFVVGHCTADAVTFSGAPRERAGGPFTSTVMSRTTQARRRKMMNELNNFYNSTFIPEV